MRPSFVLFCLASARSEEHLLEWQTCILLSFCLFVPVCSFAEDVIHIYYESDEVVCEDVELQAFVKDIYVYGMRGVKASGKMGWPSCVCSLCSPC